MSRAVPAATMPLHAASAWASWHAGLRYGALGLPLAFVALPLYVVLPNHYATAFGIPLATLGALLLGARLLDALADPWIGRIADHCFAHSLSRPLAVAAPAAVLLAASFHALWFPPSSVATSATGLLAWCAAMLALTYLSYSVLSVLHQAWGARLGGDAAQRAAIVSWREGFALAGVLVASVLPSLAGLSATSAVFAVTLAAGLALLSAAPRARPLPAGTPASITEPWAAPAFRRLLLVYLVNGVASAVPATLVLFFIRDLLQAPTLEPLFLFAYFAAGALSMPAWVRAVGRFGLVRCWLAGMLLAVAGFAGVTLLAPGHVVAYALICVASGAALGADLVVPGALLTGVIQRAGHAGRLEGSYFGWWNFATKLNLALAAGLALPLLGLFGYAPGSRDDDALQALVLAYGVLPCVLKLAAAALLWRLHLQPTSGHPE